MTSSNAAAPRFNQNCLLELRNAALVYRALPALKDVNWQFMNGQQWACLGPNGSGKTSLARILSSQATHFSGEFLRSEQVQNGGVAYVCFEQQKTLCDRDKKLDESEFRQDACDPGTLVRDAILGGEPAGEAFELWTQRLNMSHILHRGLRFISTGEMRKTLLVKSILASPALLILDSPLDGLDRASQREMQGIIAELLDAGQSVLMLCRQAEDIPPAISHVMVMHNGTVQHIGERQAVLSDPAVITLMNPPVKPFSELPPQQPRPYVIPGDKPLLSLEQVSVAYGNTQVLNNVNWTFNAGQHCCVSGPNGCGKSTLLSLVTGDNHKAYRQAIDLFGLRRGSGESVWDIKQKFGQLDTLLHLNFSRGFKVLEVVVSGFFDTMGLYDDWGDQQKTIAEQWLAALGLEQHSKQSFDTLSFGLQRMVLLARAMVKSPKILLLDEPSLGLDGHHRRLLLDAIDHIAKHCDTQVIYVSHSAGDIPGCINQHLEFVPTENGFQVVCKELQP